MFKRLFGKADDEQRSGLNVSHFAEFTPPAEPPPDEPDAAATDHLPSKKPAPRVDDLTLPETLAEEATHPREVDLRIDFTAKAKAQSQASDKGKLTDAQIDEIAKRVADKLAASVVGDELRETVRQIVSETSERLIREEIARIRSTADPQ